ncbi:MAG: hypothetical protein NWE79_07680, partial [Candidatus Bathyarchaeota archaeon]|nr:hypothetical protein [Candidatus Bathyarchaeota archaeon]
MASKTWVRDLDEAEGERGAIARQDKASGSPLLLAIVIVSHAMNHLQMSALPVLYPDLLDEFNLSYVELGLLRSASSFASGFPQMFVGFMRRWIPGRVLLGVGNLISSSMTVLASLARSFQQ